MQNVKYLGKVVKRYASNIVETDKGIKLPAGTEVVNGYVMVQEGSRRLFLAPEAWAELEAAQKPKELKYKTGVTKALRGEADSLEIAYTVETTKDELVAAISAEKAAREEANKDA